MKHSIKKVRKLMLPCVALVISICAIVVSISQIYQSERHVRLSVRPHLNFLTNMAVDELDDKVGIFLENNGIGPAVIKKIHLEIENSKIEDCKDILKNDTIQGIGTDKLIYWCPDEGEFFKPGKNQPMLYTTYSNVEEDWEKFKEIFSEKIYIKIKYCSVYATECWDAVLNNVVNNAKIQPVIQNYYRLKIQRAKL